MSRTDYPDPREQPAQRWATGQLLGKPSSLSGPRDAALSQVVSHE
jgi:hypothetical protein